LRFPAADSRLDAEPPARHASGFVPRSSPDPHENVIDGSEVLSDPSMSSLADVRDPWADPDATGEWFRSGREPALGDRVAVVASDGEEGEATKKMPAGEPARLMLADEDSENHIDDGWDDRPSDRNTVPSLPPLSPDALATTEPRLPDFGPDATTPMAASADATTPMAASVEATMPMAVDATTPTAALPEVVAPVRSPIATMPMGAWTRSLERTRAMRPAAVDENEFSSPLASSASLASIVEQRLAQLPPIDPQPDADDDDAVDTIRPVAIPQVAEEQAQAIIDAADRGADLGRIERTEPESFQEAVRRRARARRQIVAALGVERAWLRRALVPIIVSQVAVAVIVGCVARWSSRAPVPAREAHVALTNRTPLVDALDAPSETPPPQGCAAEGAARMLAEHAQLASGLDVAVLDTGFAVGLAAPSEAVGVRVSGSRLRVTETLRVKTSAPGRVTIDPGADDASLDLRSDSDDARTIIGAAAPAFRVVARGGYLVLAPTDAKQTKILWALPGVHRKPSRPAFLSQYDSSAEKPAPIHPSEVVRASARQDGGAIIALRRPSMLMVGLVDPSLEASAPLASIVRKGATVGAPAVAGAGGGGVMAWAEKSAGETTYSVLVADVTASQGATHVGLPRVVAKGMSPSLAQLPDGDVLLAYADGAAGAHRVVAVRLDSDLVPRGEPVVVSPENLNAGMPVAAVRADGRALVAFFASSRGKAAVLATPLACDPGQ
jgi:hypothetical protein